MVQRGFRQSNCCRALPSQENAFPYDSPNVLNAGNELVEAGGKQQLVCNQKKSVLCQML